MLPQLDRTCWVALEVTGSAFDVHDMLSAHVGRVLLANPIDLQRFGSGRHTDRVDAARLAKMLAVGTIPTVWVCRKPAVLQENLPDEGGMFGANNCLVSRAG